jgi:hypothetical protein
VLLREKINPRTFHFKRKIKTDLLEVYPIRINQMSFQSIAAKDGNLAERLLCDSLTIKTAFSTFFSEEGTVKMVGGRKKSDIQFVGASKTIPIQNKNGNLSGRGHSVHRSNLNVLVEDHTARTLIQSVCLTKKNERPHVTGEISREIVRRCMFGSGNAPEYFTHTKIVGGQISELWICKSDSLRDAVMADIYELMLVKRTCVHLSPAIYLQRKGGGKKDHSPEDIQIKFRLQPYIHLFKQIL